MRDSGRESRSTAAGEEGWSAALLKAAGILALAVAGLMLLPDQLLTYLSTRVSPRTRDALVTLFVVAFFVGLSWAFTAVQRPRRG